MDYRYLKAFLTVAETKSFTVAADRLKIAQSAVSRQIRLLEETVGQQLFVRSRKLVLLTPAGVELNLRARTFTDWCDSSFGHAVPEVRIGGIQGAIDGWLLERLENMNSKVLMNFNIRVMDDDQVYDGLIRGELDMGLTTQQIENETLTSRRVLEETFSLISARPVDMKRLHEECWISGQRGRYLPRLTRKEPRYWIKVNSLYAIQTLVAAGWGIAVLPDHTLLDRFKFRRMSVKVEASAMYLSMPNYRMLPPHLKALLAALTS